MKLIDSNIVIYASKPGGDFLHSLLGGPAVAVSVIAHGGDRDILLYRDAVRW